MNDFMVYVLLHWGAVIMYAVATVSNVFGLIFDKERTEGISYYIAYTGFAAHSLAILYWWNITGHGPYITRNEVLSSDAWIMLVLFLVFSRLFPRIKPASIIVFPATFLLIALGLFFNPEIESLPPTFRSIWLVMHISFYKIALATIIVAVSFSVFYILKKRTRISWLTKLPELESIDIYAYRFAGFGFTFWAIAMLAGSIWAHQSWGRFWGWDPVETWSLITWAVLGLHLHLRRFFSWRGERSAFLYLACFAVSVFSLFFAVHSSISIHSEYFK